MLGFSSIAETAISEASSDSEVIVEITPNFTVPAPSFNTDGISGGINDIFVAANFTVDGGSFNTDAEIGLVSSPQFITGAPIFATDPAITNNPWDRVIEANFTVGEPVFATSMVVNIHSEANFTIPLPVLALQVRQPVRFEINLPVFDTNAVVGIYAEPEFVVPLPVFNTSVSHSDLNAVHFTVPGAPRFDTNAVVNIVDSANFVIRLPEINFSAIQGLSCKADFVVNNPAFDTTMYVSNSTTIAFSIPLPVWNAKSFVKGCGAGFYNRNTR